MRILHALDPSLALRDRRLGGLPSVSRPADCRTFSRNSTRGVRHFGATDRTRWHRLQFRGSSVSIAGSQPELSLAPRPLPGFSALRANVGMELSADRQAPAVFFPCHETPVGRACGTPFLWAGAAKFSELPRRHLSHRICFALGTNQRL